MDREQYIEMLKNNQFNVDINLLYEIYKQKAEGKYEIVFDLDNFTQFIKEYVRIVGTSGIIQTLKDHYDRQFGIFN
jgi:uncharacterized protein YeeX (DUF496 family)